MCEVSATPLLKWKSEKKKPTTFQFTSVARFYALYIVFILTLLTVIFQPVAVKHTFSWSLRTLASPQHCIPVACYVSACVGRGEGRRWKPDSFSTPLEHPSLKSQCLTLGMGMVKQNTITFIWNLGVKPTRIKCKKKSDSCGKALW